MEDENKKYGFLETEESGNLFADLDFALKSGQHIQNYPHQVELFNYIEKYARSNGNAPDGLYCYNFNLNTNPFDFQPSGAMNMSKFKVIEFEFSTYQPPLDPSASVFTICNPNSGEVIGVNKPAWRIYDYNFNMYLMEERVNMVTFVGGNAGLVYAT